MSTARDPRPVTLPADDNVNAYTFCVELKGSQWFLQKGKMIAYYGQIDFNGVGHGRLDRLVRTSFHSPLHASDWVVAEGCGKMLLADRAFDVNSYDLDDGNLTIRSGQPAGFPADSGAEAVDRAGFSDADRHRKVRGRVERSGGVHGAADPGGPAGPGRLGRLPVPVPPLRPRLHDRRDGRSAGA